MSENQTLYKTQDTSIPVNKVLQQMKRRVLPNPLYSNIPAAPVNYDQAYELFKYILAVHLPGAVFKDEEKSIIQNLIRYFINDTSGDYSIYKGVYIYGNFGTGKSKLMQLMHHFTHAMQFNEFANVSYKSIFHEVQKDGFKKIPKLKAKQDMRIDDLGFAKETMVQSYGNKADLLEMIIHSRYELWQTHGYRTYYTSNLPISSAKTNINIEQMYGIGIAGRITDSCNVILYNFNQHR